MFLTLFKGFLKFISGCIVIHCSKLVVLMFFRLLHIAVAKGNEMACRYLAALLLNANISLDIRNDIMQVFCSRQIFEG